jgi:hypothetical protein
VPHVIFSFFGLHPGDCITDGMITADALETYRQANRRVANVEACEASAVAETAERDREKAAVIVNTMFLVGMTPLARL